MNTLVLDRRLSSSEKITHSVHEMLGERRGNWRALLGLVGPGVVVSVAYMDPGNFVTNIQAGAQYNYSLLWVVVLASATAVLFQMLSAKLGVVTGHNLAELSREHLPPALVLGMWLASEVAAMATDLAELLGGALGVSLLCHVPLLPGLIITAAITCAMLLLGNRGFRPLELAIGVLVGAIGMAYAAELFLSPVAWSGVFKGLVGHELPDANALNLAVGIVGATVMPHTLYLHSGLTQARVPVRTDAERTKLVTFTHREVGITLALAGFVNVAMIIASASAFHDHHANVSDIQDAYRILGPAMGAAAAGLFLVALISSGISSSVVGTMAGQVIVQGFVKWRIPLWFRRAITMLPSFFVVGAGINPTKALLSSQVILSLTLSLPMLALVWLTGRRDVMGVHRNRPRLQGVAWAATAAVLVLNATWVLQAFGINAVR
ncbi:Nramp family divalent metal transporter [Dyella nitratireducens]|uniref:Divalent metal cation transporter MntH n=1 Tax=Dyella nitratireducens TaxID=1849580 RepID=A0ABQ1GF59_9GAMM|nr:Nramp family divalent metal transporter [Dyella nitratireducens]GGA42451.1 divalent metal cation transporter MntH [Dyella nitratireducens]GLQ41999.1 divalent metal cation transporter MntH [Dyella nitratireducens]